jgi:hypothetical protein
VREDISSSEDKIENKINAVKEEIKEYVTGVHDKISYESSAIIAG